MRSVGSRQAGTSCSLEPDRQHSVGPVDGSMAGLIEGRSREVTSAGKDLAEERTVLWIQNGQTVSRIKKGWGEQSALEERVPGGAGGQTRTLLRTCRPVPLVWSPDGTTQCRQPQRKGKGNSGQENGVSTHGKGKSWKVL